jgi:hypothetical protein
MPPAADKHPKSKGKRVVPKGNPWQKGQSGNPKGRPKGTKFLSEYLRGELQNPATSIPAFQKLAEQLELPANTPIGRIVIAATLVAACRDANPSLLRELWDRAEGKVPEQVNHGGAMTFETTGTLKIETELAACAKEFDAYAAGRRLGGEPVPPNGN